jgi:DtxR family Mn-dependent transcriptional regulator
MRGRGGSIAVDDYLSTIYRLEEVFGAARTNDIAEELGVRPASVSKVVRRLASEGYVVWSRFRGFKLTERGTDLVRPLIRKHRICEAFLSELGFDLIDSHRYAHHMEHLPQQIVESIHRFIGSPKRCPHGNPIPGEDTSPAGRPLAEYNVGEVVKVVGYGGELTAYLKKAIDTGLILGATVEIVSKQKLGMDVKVDNEIRRLDSKTARTVLAIPCSEAP